jgi:hypothetical protein
VTRCALIVVLLAVIAPLSAAAQSDSVASKPPAFTFKPGGFFETDLLLDFNPIGSGDTWDPRQIPVDGSEGQKFRIHARETRLSMDVRGPVQGRELRMYIETDFMEGTGYSLRVRHLYGTWGPLLAGQTWSTFMDELVIPRTINSEPPSSFPFLRVAQVRVTNALGANGTWSLAMEEPSHKIDIPPNLSGNEEHPLPDITGRVRWSGDRWHAQLSGFAGLVRFRPESGGTQQDALWGLALGGETRVGKKDAVSAQGTVGNGVARFRGGTVAAFDDSSTLSPINAIGVVASYDHDWSDRFTSTASYGWATVDLDGQRTGDPTRSATYASVNLLWWFLPERAWFGGEYLFGSREVQSGADGQANRIQLAFTFIIP